jgi:hypothetical protein
MSRILRRPLFRGGPVSSYGTGIASGLADGGRVGFRYGGSYAASGTQGKVLGSDLMNFIKSNPKLGGLEYFDTLSPNKYYSPTTYRGSRRGPRITDSPEFLKLFQNYSDPDIPLIDPDKVDLETGTADLEINEGETEIKDTSDEYIPPEAGSTRDIKEKEWSGEIDSTPSKEALEIAGITETGAEEPVTKDTDLGIKEMADEYFELMGGKKARIQDASDYALQFFKSTVGEGKDMKQAAGDVADLALSKPSKTEVIKNWATKTAIVRQGQMDDLEARIKSSESVADKNILAAQWKQLNAQGQWEKKINTILADKYGGDESKRKAATMDALGQPASLSAALMAYEKAFGLGMKPNQMAFEGMVSEYYDPAPENWEDNANVSGTYYVPGSMVVVVIEKGKLKNQKDYSK